MTKKTLTLILTCAAILLAFSGVAYAYSYSNARRSSGTAAKAHGQASANAVSSTVLKASAGAVTTVSAGQSQAPGSGTASTTSPAAVSGTAPGTSPTAASDTAPGTAPVTSPGISLADVLQAKGISAPIPNLKIVVQKTAHLLTLYSGDTALKSYDVDLGDNGLGDKLAAGDHKTPEGNFTIVEKSVLTPADKYLGTRWMRLGYPNIEDAQRGLSSGLIDQATYTAIANAVNNGQISPQNTVLGGGVGIHGGNDNNGPGNWTFGCVGLSNADVNEIFNYVSVGTPVLIQHYEAEDEQH